MSRPIDITGRRFGSLVALERKGSFWRCACDCGHPACLGVVLKRGAELRGGKSTRCSAWRNTPKIDGDVYGCVQVIRFAGTGPRGQSQWEVRCDCGHLRCRGTFQTDASRLRNGRCTTCGAAGRSSLVIFRGVAATHKEVAFAMGVSSRTVSDWNLPRASEEDVQRRRLTGPPIRSSAKDFEGLRDG